MGHILNTTQLEGFESTTVLASSSSEPKRLLLHSVLKKDFTVSTGFEVTNDNQVVYATENLKEAIDYYNAVGFY